MKLISITYGGADFIYPAHQILKLGWLHASKEGFLRFQGDPQQYSLSPKMYEQLSQWLLSSGSNVFWIDNKV